MQPQLPQRLYTRKVALDSQTVAGKPPAAVQLDHVSLLFGGFVALRELSLTLPAGASVVLLGENGAGKSTLLRVIAGLVSPSFGSLTVLGDAPRNRRGCIALMGHASQLYDELTAMENLTFFASLHASASAATLHARAEQALREVALDPANPRRVGEYSQGMKQRTALARVLLTEPSLLLLDEPFSNLDAASAQGMIGRLQQWLAQAGPDGQPRTLILTTHQPELARALARITLTLSAGQLSFAGGRMIYLGHVLTHLRKDLRLEWRSKDFLNGMLFFTLLVLVVFAIAFDPTSYPTIARQISGGLLWVALLFASMTALNQSWSRELRNNVLDAHRLSPAPASAFLPVGKAVSLIFSSLHSSSWCWLWSSFSFTTCIRSATPGCFCSSFHSALGRSSRTAPFSPRSACARATVS